MKRRAIRVVIVSVLFLAGGQMAPGAPPGRGAPGEPAGDRPAGTIAFSSLAPRGWDLYLFEVASRRTRRLTDHPALDFNAAFATDGRSLAFISTRDGNHELYATTIDGAMPRRLTEEFAMDDHPAWSPDGTQVVFSSTRRPSDRPGLAWNALYVLRIDRARGGSASGPAVDSEVRRLSPAGVADYSPAWSPKGDLIACASGSGQAGGTDIVVMTPNGSGRRRVVKDGGWPAFAADGRSLFFHGKRQGRWSVWRVGLDGSGLERVTPPDVDAFTPSASGDGSRLAVAVSRNDHRQIGLVDLSRRGLTVLTDEPVDHWNPTISPDGRFIAYHKSTPGMAVPNVEPWGAPRDGSAAVPAGRGLPRLRAGWSTPGPHRRQLRPARRDERRWLGAPDAPQGPAARALQHLVGAPWRSDRLRAGAGVRRGQGGGRHRHHPPRRLGLHPAHPVRRQQRFPRVRARWPPAGLPLGARRVEEPGDHGRRWLECPPADRGEVDRHDGRLVAGRPLDRLRQRSRRRLRDLADQARWHRLAPDRRRRRSEQSSPFRARRPLDRLHQPSRRLLGRGDQPAPPAPALWRPVRGTARRYRAGPPDPQRLRGGHARWGPRLASDIVPAAANRSATGDDY